MATVDLRTTLKQYHRSLEERLAIAAALPSEPEPEVCPDCDNAGFIIVRPPYEPGQPFEQGRAVACPNPNCPARLEQEAHRQQILFRQARIPKGYASIGFAEWESLARDWPHHMDGKWDALGAARAFVAASERDYWFSLIEASEAVNLPPDEDAGERRNSIVFAGANGIGKTTLAAAIASVALAQQRPVLYARTMDFFEALKEHMNSEDTQGRMRDFPVEWGDTEQAVIRTFQTVPLLILDEFNMEQYTEWRLDHMEMVIRYRAAHQMATIFTTNLGYDQLADYWDFRIGHAIHGMAHWVTMGGLELRRRNGERVSR